MAEKSPFSKVDQIGVIVKDLDKTVEYYESLGIGPFKSLKLTYTERKLRGKPADDIKINMKVAQMGPIQLELVQPVAGESLPKEFLESRGEGVNHLGFFVDDIDKEVAKLEKKGHKVVFRTRFQGGGGTAHFDTDRIGGITLELIQWPPE